MTWPRWCRLAYLLAFCALGACKPRVQPPAEVHSNERPSMPKPLPASMTNTPIAGIFPPQWRIGQTWRVVCKTKIPKPDMPGPDPRTFGDVFFRFRVAKVPDDANALYRLDAVREDEVMETYYQIYYRPDPFSFDHYESRDRSGPMSARNGVKPFVRGDPDRLILDFPMMPPASNVFRPITYETSHVPYTQTISRTEDGVRVVLESQGYRLEFIWNKGMPWWSTVDLSFTPLLNGGSARIFNGSGRLLP